jgi:hypothetical protein
MNSYNSTYKYTHFLTIGPLVWKLVGLKIPKVNPNLYSVSRIYMLKYVVVVILKIIERVLFSDDRIVNYHCACVSNTMQIKLANKKFYSTKIFSFLHH